MITVVDFYCETTVVKLPVDLHTVTFFNGLALLDDDKILVIASFSS
jgi:hypothetical protein